MDMDCLVNDTLDRFKNVKPLGKPNQWTASCPAHEDRENSLTVGVGKHGNKVVLSCKAGCDTKAVLAAAGLAFSDLYLNANSEVRGVTVGQLSHLKRIPRETLEADFSLRDEKGEDDKYHVVIPYFDRDGTPRRERIRTGTRASKGSKWGYGTAADIVPYGLWLLDKAKDKSRLLIVEGETDVWACHYHDVPVVGVPGSDNTNCLDPKAFADFAEVFVWRELDAAASKFAKSVCDKFKAIGREVKVVSRDGIKDPADLHFRFTSLFREEMAKCFAAAQPFEASKPPIPPPPKGVANIIIPANLPPRTLLPDGSPPPERDHTDEGNADRLVDRHGEDMRWVEKFNYWLTWTGSQWAEDECRQVRQWCEDTTLAIYTEAVEQKDTLKQVPLLKHAAHSRSAERKGAMERLSKDKAGMAVRANQFDAHRHLLNCPNGTIDLATGTVRAARRDDYLTKASPVKYDADAKCPTWDRFLASIFPISPSEQTGNRAIITFVQRLFGLAASGWVEQIMPIFHGGGSNGKSTLVTTVMSILGGGYAKTAGKNFLTPEKDEHPTVIAALQGCRLLCVNETPAGKKLDAQLVKMLTSHEDITARVIAGNPFSFSPTHTIIMCTNHQPRVADADDGIWRRLVSVPFKARFWNPDKGETGPAHTMQDKSLLGKLAEESEGILAWLVRGAFDYHHHGLPETPEIINATKEYRRSEDAIGQFLSEATSRADANSRLIASELYALYREWCETNNEHPKSSRAFYDMVRSGGYTVGPGTGNKTTVFGIKLNSPAYAGRKLNSDANTSTGSLSDLDD